MAFFSRAWQGAFVARTIAGFAALYNLCFFQAENVIRDLTVTGVQTCALPIYRRDDLAHREEETGPDEAGLDHRGAVPDDEEIGRASCRGRGQNLVVAVFL